MFDERHVGMFWEAGQRGGCCQEPSTPRGATPVAAALASSLPRGGTDRFPYRVAAQTAPSPARLQVLPGVRRGSAPAHAPPLSPCSIHAALAGFLSKIMPRARLVPAVKPEDMNPGGRAACVCARFHTSFTQPRMDARTPCRPACGTRQRSPASGHTCPAPAHADPFVPFRPADDRGRPERPSQHGWVGG